MTQHTRRDFLAKTSLAVAGATVGATWGARTLPAMVARSPLPASAFLPEPMAPLDLQALALRAVEAAKSAGASYADIRFAERQSLNLFLMGGRLVPSTRLSSTCSYGIRTVVDGTWSFVHGNVPTADAVTTSAQNAVATARGYAKVTKQRVELAPAPVTKGEWTTPIKTDPFSISLQDQTDLLGAFNAAASRVISGGTNSGFGWTRETRVFASTEGSLTTQTFYNARPSTGGGGDRGMGSVSLNLRNFGATAAGYEAVMIPDLQDQVKAAAEEAIALASLPARPLDVGRYPVVFDGVTLGAALGYTLGQAFEMDRVLGYEADASGTSFLAPAKDFLGTQVFGQPLTVTGNRRVPDVASVKWDDEGVEPSEYTLIKDGRVMDYHTSRQTAVPLKDWYQAQGQPYRSHGCALAPDADDPVVVRPAHLSVAPSTSKASIEDLYRDMPHGILVRQASYFSTDQQLASGSLNWGLMLEIEKGKIVRRIKGASLQFSTVPFWKALTAVGDASTVLNGTYSSYKGQPWKTSTQGIDAPAGYFKEVNVIALGRKL